MKSTAIAALTSKPKLPKTRDGFMSEVGMQTTRLTGATAKLLKNYAEAPARYFKRGGGFLHLANNSKKVKPGAISV